MSVRSSRAPERGLLGQSVKRITDKNPKWYSLDSSSKNCVQIYHDKNILTLINHAGNNGFGGVGFKPIDDKTRYKFANFLRKVVKKLSPIEEVQLIGCDVNKCFAQFIANACGMNIRTLPNLHEKFPNDIFGEGESMLKFFKDYEDSEHENLFLYGYAFNNFQRFKDVAEQIENSESNNERYIYSDVTYVKVTVGSDELFILEGEQEDGYEVEDLLDYVNGEHSNTNLYEPELKRKNFDEKLSFEQDFKTKKPRAVQKVNNLSTFFG